MEENPLRGVVVVPNPQEVLTQLALCGSETWNNWRAGKLSDQESEQLATKLELKSLPPPDASVDFSDIDFSSSGMPDFTGMDFGDNADFSRTKFGENVRFDNTNFGQHVKFAGATFGHKANFEGVNFGLAASFEGATFGFGARFDDVTFGPGLSFGLSKFGPESSFRYAVFGAGAEFFGAIFEFTVNFHRANFRRSVGFEGATFQKRALFTDVVFEGEVRFGGRSRTSLALVAEGLAERIGEEDPKNWSRARLSTSAPEDFQSIAFAGCKFAGLTDFSNRNFRGSTNFRNVSFSTPPIFTNVDGLDNIDPTGMTVRHIGNRRRWFRPWRVKEWTTDSAIAVRVRQLRKLMEEIKAHDVERRLFIMERRLERGPLWRRNPPVAVVHTLALFLFGVLSNYGRSVVAPLAWFVFALLVSHAFTQQAFNTLPDIKPRGFWDDRLLELSLGNALPIFGTLGGNRQALLTELFPTGVPTAVELLSVGHSIISVILIFLILLAIRNLFKIG